MIQDAGTSMVLRRSDVVESNRFRFYTGKPCNAGHFSERFVSNRQCIACNAIKARQREALRGLKDPSFRMYRNVQRRTGMALKGRASPANAVGCDHPELRDHIANQFRIGMSWDRYRQWQVDHVKPLSSARSLSELIALCHYSNLQPLWRSENLKKGGA
jgi:hypothetical protein